MFDSNLHGEVPSEQDQSTGDKRNGLVAIDAKRRPQAQTITQEDLEQLIYLRRQLDEAHEAWLAKREEIRVAVEAGAETEPGVHQAMILSGGSFRRLVVR